MITSLCLFLCPWSVQQPHLEFSHSKFFSLASIFFFLLRNQGGLTTSQLMRSILYLKILQVTHFAWKKTQVPQHIFNAFYSVVGANQLLLGVH